jgi:hypothetical protein
MNNYYTTADNLPPDFCPKSAGVLDDLPPAPDFDELADNLDLLNRKIYKNGK